VIALHVDVGSGTLWGAWSIDSFAVIGIPLVALLYARGLHSLGSRKRFHSTWRPWAFYAGLLASAVALLSPLDHLSDELFYAHMTQHFLLMMVAAPLMLLGAPIIPMLRGVPRPVRRNFIIPVAKSPPVRTLLRLLTQPLVTWPLFVGMLFFWHVPAFFEAALGNEAVHAAEHLSFGVAGFLFWWNVVDPHPLRPNLSYLARIPYIFITVVPSFILGAFLTFSDGAWFAPYEATAPLHGLTALEDQQIGGIVMWIPGSFIIGTALMIDLYLTARREQETQLAHERQGG
jgi:putative membrane protein